MYRILELNPQLVDFSGDTYHHFIAMGRTLWDIEHVLITHSHVDHFTFESFAVRCGDNCKGFLAPKLKFYTSAGVIERLWECLRVRGNKKLEKIPAEPVYIMTKWGVGYYFKGESQPTI